MTKPTKPEKIKKLFKGVKVSTWFLVWGLIAVFLMPYFNTILKVNYGTVDFHWFTLQSGWAVILVGLLLKFLEKWDGKIKK